MERHRGAVSAPSSPRADRRAAAQTGHPVRCRRWGGAVQRARRARCRGLPARRREPGGQRVIRALALRRSVAA